MAMNDFVPMSWNGEPISQDKLNQMCNNTQWLYDRSPRIRYSISGLTRDTGLKVLSGKTAFSADPSHDGLYVDTYFGSYFSSGCHPAVTATIEPIGGHQRKYASIMGLAGSEIDQTGFRTAVVSIEAGVTSAIDAGGWIHWTAVGY